MFCIFHLYCVFTYIHALQIDRDLCECRNVLINFPCIFHLETSSFFQKSSLLSLLVLSVVWYFPYPCFLHIFSTNATKSKVDHKIIFNINWTLNKSWSEKGWNLAGRISFIQGTGHARLHKQWPRLHEHHTHWWWVLGVWVRLGNQIML